MFHRENGSINAYAIAAMGSAHNFAIGATVCLRYLINEGGQTAAS